MYAAQPNDTHSRSLTKRRFGRRTRAAQPDSVTCLTQACRKHTTNQSTRCWRLPLAHIPKSLTSSTNSSHSCVRGRSETLLSPPPARIRGAWRHGLKNRLRDAPSNRGHAFLLFPQHIDPDFARVQRYSDGGTGPVSFTLIEKLYPVADPT
jgi:hypothetical protein